MKLKFLIFLLTLGACFESNGQMSLSHSFSGSNVLSEAGIVNFTRSGKKYVFNTVSDYTDTLTFYNMDFSFWKRIIIPYIPGRRCGFNMLFETGTPAIGLFYPSEQLFNTDTFLEVAVVYQDSVTMGVPSSVIKIINENGVFTDSITSVFGAAGGKTLHVYTDTGNHFKAAVNKMNGNIDIYSLPGTLPCDPCSGGILRISSVDYEREDFHSQPIPNPSKDEVKINFTLPEGTEMGLLQLFNTAGKKIREYKIDNRFGYIMVDNTQLPAGMYYYNIVVEGRVSSTQKILVIK